MPKSVFVVGIGGTGMRCIESFVHLCAIGMFDDTEVHLLAMDTDKDNGNFRRLALLVDNYMKINGGNTKKETLFSAKINYYQFSPDYDKNDHSSMSRILDNTENDKEVVGSGAKVKVKAKELAGLLIRPEVENMSLAHGYRAQTQMGSLLMYYALLEEAYKSKNSSSGLREFLSNLSNGVAGKQIFVFGSVFGGTGASSLPIIPSAFNAAAKIMFGDNIDVVKSNYYGAVVLTNYFTFDIQSSEKVYATADKFALNSQAALNFYRTDNTVKNVYKRLYLLGREGNSLRKLPSGGTGGADQCNPSDFIELMSAFAAHDFFKLCDSPDANFGKSDNNFVCRGIEDGQTYLKFENFTEDYKEFTKRLGVMTITSFIDSAYDYFDNLRKDTAHFDENELVPLRNYFKLFGIEPYIDDKGRQEVGWLNQIVQSAKDCGYQEGAFFMPTLFNCREPKQFAKYDINEKVFNMKTPPSFRVKLFSNPFNVIKDKVKEIRPENNNSLEQLIERTFIALCNLYSFPVSN